MAQKKTRSIAIYVFTRIEWFHSKLSNSCWICPIKISKKKNTFENNLFRKFIAIFMLIMSRLEILIFSAKNNFLSTSYFLSNWTRWLDVEFASRYGQKIFFLTFFSLSVFNDYIEQFYRKFQNSNEICALMHYFFKTQFFLVR